MRMDRTRILWTVVGVVIGIVVGAVLAQFIGYENWIVPIGAGAGAGIAAVLDANRRKKSSDAK